MARYYRRRYTRVVRPKKKWASCINIWRNNSISITPYIVDLATNSAQTATPTPSIVKVGNFKVTADLVARFSEAVNTSLIGTLYIMFVPEGVSGSSAIAALPTQHPEYIMATKVIGSSYQSGTVISLDTVNVSTRMKRNLNSGDKVVMYLDFSGLGTPTSVSITGNVRYWACTN